MTNVNRNMQIISINTRNQSGISLLEVLITVVILAAGLLGVASMQVLGMQENHSAYMRSQTSVLAYDVMDRMRNNRNVALTTNDYLMNFGDTTSFTTNCALATCTPTETADYDLAMWTANIAATLPQGQGQTSFDAANEIYTVQIRWRDSRRGDRDGDSDEDEEFATFSYKGEL